MKVTADFLIDRRKRQWENHNNINKDEEFVIACAIEIVNNEELRKEIVEYPEKLIELIFVVVDKEKKVVPFFLNDVQHEFLDTLNKAKEDYEKGLITDISLLILKGRQQGFTTVITAYQLAQTITHKNCEGLTLADKASNTEAIFQNKAKFIYNRMPSILRPSEKYNSKRQMLFDKLNSSWAVDTATKDVGRSRTINFFHGSECAFWKDGIAKIQASLGETFTQNAIKIYETTANGFNDYRTMWKSGSHINCFYEWWKTKEYRLNFETKNQETKFKNDIYRVHDWIHERLRWLKEDKGLDYNQLYWYYKKYKSYIDTELIKQEYPCTPEEAFVSSGKCYFNKEEIVKKIDYLESKEDKGVLRTGYFKYKLKSVKTNTEEIKKQIYDIEFEDDINGCIQIIEEPKKNYPYCLGGDTAGEGSDYFTGIVVDNVDKKIKAKLRLENDETEYTRQIYCLGMYYNKALIGLEVNFSTYPTKMLSEEYDYPNLYIRTKEDTIPNKLIKSYGFRTDRNTRPLILAMLQQIFKENLNCITDIDILRESLTFIKNDKGRPEAQQDCHDDLILGTAIAYYISSQQDIDIKKIEQINNTKKNTFFSEFYDDEDCEKIEVF